VTFNGKSINQWIGLFFIGLFLLFPASHPSASCQDFLNHHLSSSASSSSSRSAVNTERASQAQLRSEQRQASQSLEVYGEKLEYSASGSANTNVREINELTIQSYNLLNLELTKGKFIEDVSSGKMIQFKQEKLKDPVHRTNQAKSIKEVNPDIAVFIEVENIEALKRFNEDYLDNHYEPLLLKGNDGRGIDIGFMIKRSLNLEARLQSFKEFTANYKGQEIPIFSRDFPVLEIREKGSSPESKPLLIIAGTHLKSQRDKMDDAKSTELRKAQVDSMIEIKSLYEQKYGKDVPFIIAGDFNNSTNPNSLAREFRALTDAGLQDAFDVAIRTDFGECNCRVTHTYHPKGGETKKQQLDSFQVSDSLRGSGAILEAGIQRYKDENGKDTPIPDTYEQRKQNPSDHFPIWLKIDLRKLQETN
jgi:hypothetical protein